MTRDEILEMINHYKEAEKAVLMNKRYRIGTREFEREDLGAIRKGRQEWEYRLKLFDNGGKGRKVVRVVPTDI